MAGGMSTNCQPSTMMCPSGQNQLCAKDSDCLGGVKCGMITIMSFPIGVCGIGGGSDAGDSGGSSSSSSGGGDGGGDGGGSSGGDASDSGDTGATDAPSEGG
jgi:hypothetical protein